MKKSGGGKDKKMDYYQSGFKWKFCYGNKKIYKKDKSSNFMFITSLYVNLV